MSAIENFIKSHTTYALRFAVRQLGQELEMSLRHISAVRKTKKLLNAHPVKLNLGCGPNSRVSWLNIDLFDSRADLRLDLRRHWPFPDSSVSYVYSEHVFEHFEMYGEVPRFLGEALRVLQSGGVFDVGVPDTEWPLRGYGNPNHDYWAFAPTVHPTFCKTQLDHINFHFRQGEQHKYAWDEETLAMTLERSGFVSVERRGFDPELDSESRKIGTLYMRAMKPL